jgi:hypothetical protein
MFNSHFFKILTTFIVMIMVGIALLFVSGEGKHVPPTGASQQSQLDSKKP